MIDSTDRNSSFSASFSIAHVAFFVVTILTGHARAICGVCRVSAPEHRLQALHRAKRARQNHTHVITGYGFFKGPREDAGVGTIAEDRG